MPASEIPDPLAIFHVLADADVPFVIIGGHAVNFHGYIRTTEDADIIFRRTPASEQALLKVLQGVEACWISEELDPATRLERLIPVSLAYLQSQHLMMLTTRLGFLDVYDYVPSFPETPVEELFADSATLGNLRFVSLRWLRRLKERAARNRDWDDLENLPPV